MTRVILLLLTAGLAACSSAPPERRAVEQAADALGGAARLAEVKTLVLEGKAPSGTSART